MSESKQLEKLFHHSQICMTILCPTFFHDDNNVYLRGNMQKIDCLFQIACKVINFHILWKAFPANSWSKLMWKVPLLYLLMDP